MNPQPVLTVMKKLIPLVAPLYLAVYLVELVAVNRLWQWAFGLGPVVKRSDLPLTATVPARLPGAMNKLDDFKYRFIQRDRCIFTRNFYLFNNSMFLNLSKSTILFRNNRAFLEVRFPVSILLLIVLMAVIAWQWATAPGAASGPLFPLMGIVIFGGFFVMDFMKSMKLLAGGFEEIVADITGASGREEHNETE